MADGAFTDDGITATFIHCRAGHSGAGCANGWQRWPFPTFIWTRRGHAETTYRRAELGTVDRPEGSVAYIRENETRRSSVATPEGADYFLAVYAFTRRGAEALNRFALPTSLPPATQAEMRECLRELEAAETAPPWLRDAVRRKTGYSLLTLLLRNAAERPGADAEWERLESAVQYLNTHYREPFDLAALLRETPYSRGHFYRLFRARFRQGPQEYASGLRVREAARLLLTTTAGVGEIGRAVGWDDPYLFSRMFKRHTGVSPLRYRRAPGGK